MSSCRASSHAAQSVKRSWLRLWDGVAVQPEQDQVILGWDTPAFLPRVRGRDRLVRAIATGMGFSVGYVAWNNGWHIRSQCRKTIVILWSRNRVSTEYAFEHDVLEAMVHLWKSLPLPRPRFRS